MCVCVSVCGEEEGDEDGRRTDTELEESYGFMLVEAPKVRLTLSRCFVCLIGKQEVLNEPNTDVNVD